MPYLRARFGHTQAAAYTLTPATTVQQRYVACLKALSWYLIVQLLPAQLMPTGMIVIWTLCTQILQLGQSTN